MRATAINQPAAPLADNSCRGLAWGTNLKQRLLSLTSVAQHRHRCVNGPDLFA
jgi:hypothetical protein